MYCPQCGQQQVSEEVRFCSRCGFQLGGVTGLLSTGGVLPQPVYTPETGKQKLSPRRRGVQQGVLLMFISMILTPILAVVIGPPEDPFAFSQALIPLSAIIFGGGGLLRIIYALIFQEGSLFRQKQDEGFSYSPSAVVKQMSNPAGRGAGYLPPGQSIPARHYTRADGGTAEMTPPPSVTESTTQLLDEQHDPRSR